MSMTPKTWSISALAIEFDMDRRTVAARLRHIAPCGKKRGHDVWRLADVLPVLSSARRQFIDTAGDPPPPPPGCAALADVNNPVHALAAVPMMLMAYRIPALSAIYAVEAGASCRAAYGLYAAMQLAVAMQCQSIGRACAFEPWASNPEPSIWEIDEFDEVNWQIQAAKTGETVDLNDWQNYAPEQFSESGNDG